MRQRYGETYAWMTCAFVWRGIEALFDANSGIYIRQKTAGETIATVSSDRLGSGQARTSDYILDSHRSIAPQHVDILEHVCSALGSSMSLTLERRINNQPTKERTRSMMQNSGPSSPRPSIQSHDWKRDRNCIWFLVYHGPVSCFEVLRSVYLGQVNPTLAWILLDSSHHSREFVNAVKSRCNTSAVCLSCDCLILVAR